MLTLLQSRKKRVVTMAAAIICRLCTDKLYRTTNRREFGRLSAVDGLTSVLKCAAARDRQVGRGAHRMVQRAGLMGLMRVRLCRVWVGPCLAGCSCWRA